MSFSPENFQLAMEAKKAKEHVDWAEDQMKKAALSMMQALKEIHEKQSYRAYHPTFEEYCEKRLKITRARGYQIIAAANVHTIMMGIEGGPEAVEGLGETHYRELKALPPAEMVRVVEEVRKEGAVTAKSIKRKIEGSQAPEDKNQQRLTRLILALKEELTRGPITKSNYLQASQRLLQKIYTIRTKDVDSSVKVE